MARMSRQVPSFELLWPDAQAWRAALADLALRCGCAEPGETAELLSELHSHLLTAPDGAAWSGASLPSAGRIAALLRHDGVLSVAGALVEHRAGYMLSQNAGGRAMATLVLVGSLAEINCTAANPALALAGALAEALSAVHREAPQAASRPANPRVRGSSALSENQISARLN